eukprot:934401-Pyramimonas_sp.AAC.1
MTGAKGAAKKGLVAQGPPPGSPRRPREGSRTHPEGPRTPPRGHDRWNHTIRWNHTGPKSRSAGITPGWLGSALLERSR